jgi:hypothetical protein
VAKTLSLMHSSSLDFTGSTVVAVADADATRAYFSGMYIALYVADLRANRAENGDSETH